MAYSNFTNLRIYQLSEMLSDNIWELVCKWSDFEKETIGKQLIRSADSIGANIAERNGRSTFIDNKRFCTIARGSLYETKHFLRRAYIRKLINLESIATLKIIIEELTPKLNAYINSLKKRATSNEQRATKNEHLTTN